MAAIKTSVMVVGYSYDEEDDTLVIELDGGAGAVAISDGAIFVESFLDQLDEIKNGTPAVLDNDVPVSFDKETNTLSVNGFDNIEADSFSTIIEQVYDEEF